MRRETNALELRNIIQDILTDSIWQRRSIASPTGKAHYEYLFTEATDEEVDEFILTSPFLKDEDKEQLLDPGFLGPQTKTAVTDIIQFAADVRKWAISKDWISPKNDSELATLVPEQTSEQWLPSQQPIPGWITLTPPCLLRALDILRQGGLLSQMNWRDFEELIAVLLEKEGWDAKVTKRTRDGGIDVIARKKDDILGDVLSIWQAKCYSAKHKVELKHVRELSAIRSEERATKALMVTTSCLTNDAIEWIKRHEYELGYKDHQGLVDWIMGNS